MKKPTRNLLREWAGKLKASGFQDIEVGVDKGCGLMLSNRNNCIPANETEAMQLEARAAYYESATTALTSHRFDTPRDRAVWRLHAVDRKGFAKIAAELGGTFHTVRADVARIGGAIREGDKGDKGDRALKPKAKRRHLAALIDNCEPEVLMRLAAIL